MGDVADNSHADRKRDKRIREAQARMRLMPVYSMSDALNKQEFLREHRVLEFDYPHYRATDFESGEREPE